MVPPLHSLDPGQIAVLRVRAAGTVGAVLIAALVAELMLPGWPGVVIGPVLPVAGWWLAVAPRRRWKRWSWAFTERELHVASGWLTRVHSIVPVGRVQHIDLTQGPVERRYGVATLIVHTAGTDANRVAVPGLAHADAEAIRDAIRARIAPPPPAP